MVKTPPPHKDATATFGLYCDAIRAVGLRDEVGVQAWDRAAMLQLLPFSVGEYGKVGMLRGGYPEVAQRPRSSRLWFSSYLQTYLERDIRQVINVKDSVLFRRFLALLASRHGQVLNRTDLAAPLGLSVPTISSWLGALETTLQIVLVSPFYENLGKRLIKSPKLYFLVSGLVFHRHDRTVQAKISGRIHTSRRDSTVAYLRQTAAKWVDLSDL